MTLQTGLVKRFLLIKNTIIITLLTILINHGIPLSKLPLEFLQKNNVQKIAQELLGKIIYVNINNHISSAIITETEAYQGPEDKASHAYKNKRTQRTEVMYKEGGCCYIYLCYGIHYLFNIITSKKIFHMLY